MIFYRQLGRWVARSCIPSSATDLTGRVDSNMISGALTGAVFASQTGPICRVSGRLTSRQSHTKYSCIISFGRNIWDFLYEETSANLWFTHLNHHRSDPV